MQLTLRQQLTQFAHVLQSALFPALEEQVGELGKTAKRLVATLEMIPLARFIPSSRGWMGRPSKDRYAIACAFVAKAVYGFSTTRQLLDAASDAHHITEQSRHLGHVPIVDPPQRWRNRKSLLAKPQRELSWAQQERYKERTMIERVNAT
jgi:hypothetical protein